MKPPAGEVRLGYETVAPTSSPGAANDVMRRLLVGGGWVGSARVAAYAVLSLKLVATARLLTPTDVGLMGIVLVTISFAELATVTGVEVALVQKRENVEGYLDTAWTLALVRGLALSVLIVGAAPLIAGFFHAPNATDLIRVGGLVFLLRGLTNSGTVYFLKHLQFRQQAVLTTIEPIVDALVSVALAFLLRDAWALVYGHLAGVVARVAASFVMQGYRPRLRVEWAKLRELFTFGRWVWGSSILSFAGARADGIVVTRMLGVAPFGLYQVGMKLASYTTREVLEPISQIAFPAFSRLSVSSDPGRLFLDLVRFSSIMVAPLVMLLLLFGEAVIRVLLGPQWLPVASVVGLLAVAGLCRGLGGLGGWLLYAIGRPRDNFLIGLVRTSTLLVLLVPLVSVFGLVGAAWAIVASNAIFFVAMMATLHLRGRVPISRQARAIAPAITISLICLYSPVMVARHFGSAVLSQGVAGGLLGITLYAVAAVLMERRALVRIYRHVFPGS